MASRKKSTTYVSVAEAAARLGWSEDALAASAARAGAFDFRRKGKDPMAARKHSATATRGAVYVSVAEAAARLGWSEDALGTRIRRAAVREGDVVLARLGGGVVAYRFGKSWRVVFPDVA